MKSHPALFDQPNSFGWISIALHWGSAVALLAMWSLGKSIQWQALPEDIDARRSVHVLLGFTIWLLLAARIAWRVWVPHPKAVGQGVQTHRLAVVAHAVILANIAIMMLSGPLLAWLRVSESQYAQITWQIHATAATSLALLVLVHVGAALKHLMFHDDETIARIFVPRKS